MLAIVALEGDKYILIPSFGIDILIPLWHWKVTKPLIIQSPLAIAKDTTLKTRMVLQFLITRSSTYFLE